jgi:1-acyl-sn-glycerol-3-phosphate acyltransferase
MRETSRRPDRLEAGRLVLTRPGTPNDPLFSHDAEPRFGLLRPLRVLRRGGSVVLWTLPCMPVQAIFIALPGSLKVAFARLYWGTACRLIGLSVRVVGTPINRKGGRPVVFVSNHSSWLDIPVLGGVLDACFVSKHEVGRWPVVGTIARLGRTVFVSRQRHATGRERDVMRERLAAGDNLLLFPEGTSSDGSRVMPFRSSFFAVAEGVDAPLIQPVSVVYDRLAGLPTGRASRPVFAWYGDMDLASHFWRFAQHKGLRVTVLLHPPIDPTQFASRKDLSQAVWQTVADGASRLRQNRPVDAQDPVPHTEADPAYA